MTPSSVAERVLSSRSGRLARPGDIVVCEPDLVLGTDGSVPMALDYFERMGGGRPAHPERVLFSRDHYAPPTSAATRGFHDRMIGFAEPWDVAVLSVGDGIGFLHAMEEGRVKPGDLVVGGDSHTVTCGVAGAFAVGIGSSDLAGVLKTGKVWLRVPETRRVRLVGVLPTGVVGKDVALEITRRVGGRVGPFVSLEFVGEGAIGLPGDERVVLCNMAAEMGAMAGVFPATDTGDPDPADPSGGMSEASTPISLDLGEMLPMVARPPRPDDGVPVTSVEGQPIDWVFLGTCAGGRASDFREALRVLEVGGGAAEGVTLVVTPPTARVRAELERDGTWAAFAAMGAVITETGCGPCCGTSGPIPPPGARVVSTANRNFAARMGEPTAEIFLASAATSAAAATVGKLVDPRSVA